MEIVAEKSLPAEPPFQQLHGGGIPFLKTGHGNGHTIEALQGYQAVEFRQRLAGRFLDEKALFALQHPRSQREMG